MSALWIHIQSRFVMLPVIAIVGCPNVGKSTLFNRLTRTRSALVANDPGVTRDRQYGFANLHDTAMLVCDTGGIGGSIEDYNQILEAVSVQTMQALAEADAVLWLVDGRSGLTTGDMEFAAIMRKVVKPVFLIVNKIDGIVPESAVAEFHSIGGFAPPIAVSAEAGDGINNLLDTISASFPKTIAFQTENLDVVKVAIVGRPNVGKSTLINRVTGENRVLTSTLPGTTRDSIAVPFQRRQKNYLLIDTAGIRRRHKVTDKIEKFSIIKSLKAIEICHIVILLLDARDVISGQDQTLLGMISQAGKSLIIAVNKWDGLSQQQQQTIQRQIERKTGFIDYACIRHISALHGTGIRKLFDSIDKIVRSRQQDFNSSTVTGFLNEALAANPPPVVRGRRIKLKFAHLGGDDPLRIIIHGNQTRDIPANYRRYLANHFRKKMKLTGSPVFIEFKHGDNPYKALRNTLTRRQIRKRQRVIGHSRKN